MEFPSRYDLGVQEVHHKGYKITTSLHEPVLENFRRRNSFFDYNVGYVQPGFEHRPDLISNLFYNTSAYWWLLMLVNNIEDPFEGFKLGERIVIPVI